MKPVLLAVLSLSLTSLTPSAFGKSDRLSPGRLDAVGLQGEPLGACPLKHTDVHVDITGFIARVTVRQQFHNPFDDKIEAIYVFPLSQHAAVDHMTMKVGDRVIVGEIKQRDEARQIYMAARARGYVASLLDQERPNIFTQSVANIEPGDQIDITIRCSETLDWCDGEYHFDFPMVVGPRYQPGKPSGQPSPGRSPPTDQVPDADRISPPIAPPATRAGHDISLTVGLNAGLPIRKVESLQHEVTIVYADEDKTRATIALKNQREIPNQDFVLLYQTATNTIEDTVLTHTDDRGKFFTLVLQPPKRIKPEMIVPKEIVFVIDKSGSMMGFPIETAKQAMRLCIRGLHPRDTFNLMTFEGGVGFCFPRPVANTDENRRRALDYLASLQGSGGTEMMKAVHACLAGQNDRDRQFQRVVRLTDHLHQARNVRGRLEERNKQLASEVVRRRELMNRHGISVEESSERTPPALDGVVTAVGASGFVELSLGTDDGIRLDDRLDVFTDRSFLGRVRIVRTSPNRAVGEIIPEFKKGDMRRGARVTTARNADTATGSVGRSSSHDFLAKLAPQLRGLADRVARQGKEGNLVVGKVVVKDGQVTVRLQLSSVSADTLAKLVKLGFEVASSAPSQGYVTGKIDVTKLDDLAKLDSVVRIDPAT